jgi:hypothetical protein
MSETIATRITTDANGYEIDLRERGLRLCEHCKLVMSEGFSTDNGDVYACSVACLSALGVEQSTEDEIENDDGSAVYWTDWESDESPDDAIERLMRAPYGYDHEDLHQIGWHDERSEMECNYCKQLSPSSREEARVEAVERGLDVL